MTAALLEQWVSVAGYEGHYEVSDQGCVRSVNRTVPWRGVIAHRNGKPLRQHLKASGHRTVTLVSGGRLTTTVHRLVLEGFTKVRPAGMEVCHNDGDPTNNNLSNLRWGTKSDNQFDSVMHGTHNMARKTHCNSGHEFTSANTYVYSDTEGFRHRHCRACTAENMRQYRAKRKLDRL